MDKQELLSVLGERIVKEDKEITDVSDWINGYYCGRFDALTFAYERVKWLDEPEKPEVPKEFDEWYKEIQEIKGNAAKRFALWKICQFGFGCGFEDVKDRKIIKGSLTNWVMNHKEKAVNAVLNGYTVKKEPVWVVKINEKLYFCRFIDKYFEENSDEPTYSESDNPELVKKFTDKAKAEAVATLVDGEVEEWSE
ncbi:MAG: DUF1642 domain-containing protein [Tetragenococcus koreensis]|nr:DUF1642 domain-containing protein [Tetragenococcus koreensis]